MIPLFKVFMAPDVMEPLDKVLQSGYIGQGPKVEKFEAALRDWLGVPYVTSLNSGTSALQLAAYLAGVRPGKKVISTPMTCSATNTALVAMGAEIIWADIEPNTGNIDVNSVIDILQDEDPDIVAVMCVHWGGYPCDLENLNTVAKIFKVKVIEDAAHAFGSIYRERKIGSHSDYICFSFQAIKHLTCGDGGALVCKREDDHERAKLLRWYGIDREGPKQDMRCEVDVREPGWKYHMNDINATIGLANMQYVGKIIARHRQNAWYYDRELSGLPGIKLLARTSTRASAFWLYTILVEQREAFMKGMEEAGIMVSQVHSRNDTHSMFREFRKSLPQTDLFTTEQISIPCGWWVSDSDREYIVATIKRLGEELWKSG